MGHCIATVYEYTNDRYTLINAQNQFSSQRGTASVNKDKLRRGMWIHDRVFSKEEISRGKDFKEGFYLFGGSNRDREKLNDLWLIKPEYYTNKRMIDDVNYKFTCRDPELTLNVQQITNYSGQPPCPRQGASMISVKIKKTGH